MTTKREIVLAVLVIVLILAALDIYFGSAPGFRSRAASASRFQLTTLPVSRNGLWSSGLD
jgi:hypothetical protein